MDKETQFDPRIGKHGAYQPLICAGTGQVVNGRHNTAISLGNGYFCRILNKWQGSRSEIKTELQQVISRQGRTGKRAVSKTGTESITSEGQSDD